MNMISKYLAMLPAAALLALAACSKEETEYSEELVEIRLTGSLEAQTRATHGLDTKIAEGETVHVWVDNAAGSSLYADNSMTAGSDGTLSGGKAMYFPTNGDNVNIYAVHGSLSYTDFWGETVTHTVEQDQQSSGTGYAVSDLVYGKLTGVARTSSAVSLTLSHLLSKVEVVLVQGDGSPGIGKLEILNTLLQATFTPDKASDFAVTAAGDITAGNPITIDAGTTAADATAEADKVLNEAIIVPQTLTAGTDLIRITTDKGGEFCYALPKDTDFNAGKKYRYTVTVSLTGLTVSYEIGDWTDSGTSADVTATLTD